MRLFFFNGAFWGILLIVFGGAIMIKHIFNIDLPIGRIFFATLIILIGIQLLMGGFDSSSGHTTVFSEGNFTFSKKKKEYSLAFGKADLDLSNVEITEDTHIKTTCTFGDFNIRLNPNINTEIQSSAAFGSARMPDNNETSFGSYNYKSGNFDASKPTLYIKAEVAFGSMKISY